MNPVCPLCDQKENFVFFIQKNAAVEQQFICPTLEEALQCKRSQLTLAFCENCGFIWNTAFDSRILDYARPYEASQAHSPAFQKSVEQLVDTLIQKYDVRRKTIVDVGCGDSTFLALFCRKGNNAGVGFDPSWPKGKAAPAGVTIIPEYYGSSARGIRADFITNRHVLEHLKAPKPFLRKLQPLASGKDAVFYFEVPNVSWSLENRAFWDFYYEHCGYYSEVSLAQLLRSSGMETIGILKPLGGQYLAALSRHRKGPKTIPFSKENIKKLKTLISSFSASFEKFKAALFEKLRKVSRKGKRVVVWGAGARAAAFLNLLQNQAISIEIVVDANPKKWETFIPGSGQRIVSPAFLSNYRPELILVLNPQYIGEIETSAKELGVSANLISLVKGSKALEHCTLP